MADHTYRIAHLYPDVMNVYGDRGNTLALAYRFRARGLPAEVVDIRCGDEFEPASADLVLIGGGQDREQRRIAGDLQERGPALRAAIDDGLPVLAVCGAFQLFGHRYVDHEGGMIPGIAVFDMETLHPGRQAERCIGDVVLDTGFGEVAGFENHGGRTYLAPGVEPFGKVVRGRGNNASDGSEGARYRNTIGTYLHGSLLPKNPAIADHLLGLAVERREPGRALPPLDDTLELAAHRSAVAAARKRSPARAGSR